MSLPTLTRAKWGLAALWLLTASLAAAAPAPIQGAAADSFPNAPDVILWPPFPCIENDVTFYVRGYEATPCDSFLWAYRSGDREITIRTLMRTNVRCAAAPSVFYAVPIPMGRFSAGAQTITITRHMLATDGVGALDSTVSHTELGFSVAEVCPDRSLPVPADSLPFVDRVVTVPSPACPDRPVTVHFDGHFLTGCGRLVSASLEGGVKLVLAPFPDPSAPCPMVLRPWSADVPIGFMVPGSYSVLVEETVQGSNAVWPPIFDAEYLGLFDFTVVRHCEPGTNPLPYVNHLSVTSQLGGPLCAGAPIRVNIGGEFPNDCYDLRRIELIAGSLNPTVRLLVDNGACKAQLCPNTSVPWDTSVVLPGLPAGGYSQQVQLGVVSCSDSIPPDSLFATQVPFTVAAAETCGGAPPSGCLLTAWAPGESSGCNAFLGQARTARLDLGVSTGVALSGLQGELRFLQPGLRIATLETEGVAVGMHLTWTATPQGARFVLFAEHGAPIPVMSSPVLVLKVGLEAAPVRANILWPQNGFDLQASTFGSDVDGTEVPACPTFAPVIAHICFERACDFDANGVADVRDLVRMVHCVNGDGPCPPEAGTTFDCNGDAQFSLDDVLCCAVHLLQGPSCPDCPIDSTRAEPGVRATFEAPIVTSSGIDVPLRLWGTDRIGAARLALRFPSDRFTFAGAEAHDPAWLELHQAVEGRALVGLIRVGPEIAVDGGPIVGQTVDVILHLALQPGARVGGVISVDAGEFSGPDGVMLRVDLDAAPRSLDGRAALEITTVRPNPSAGACRIFLRLTAPAQLDVAVLDLAGRRVASLFHGDQPAGTHELFWNGRASDGSSIHGGVYFVRASVNGHAAVKKVILLGSRSDSGPQALPASP